MAFSLSPTRSSKLNMPLLHVTLALMAIGLVMVASSSMPIAWNKHLGLWYFFNKQLLFAALGLIALFCALNMPIEKLRQVGPLWLLLAFFFSACGADTWHWSCS